METNFLKQVRESIKHWYVPIIIGIVFIITAFFTFTKPVASYATLAFIFSISFLFSGIMETFFAIANKDEIDNWGWTLVFGIVNIAIGVLLLKNPLLTWETLALYAGFVVLFRSVMSIGWAIDMKNYGVSDWGGMLAVGILGLLFSFILLMDPIFAGLTVVIWTGIAFMMAGIFSLYLGFRLKNLKNKLNN